MRVLGQGRMVCLIFEFQVGDPFSRLTRFKLHFRPRIGAGRQVASEIPTLPLNKTVVEQVG
jgi:hypothetical protein